MGGNAGLWARQHIAELPRGGRVSRAAREVLYTAALSCIDATGKLQYSMARLADECRLALRMTQEAVRLLSRLEFLVQGGDGFRLSRYVVERGKECREGEGRVPLGVPDGGKKCRALRDSLDSGKEFSLSPELSKPSQSPAREKRAGVSPEVLARIWEPVRGRLLRLQEGGPQFRGFSDYESLELVEMRSDSIVAGCPVELAESERRELTRRITNAAIETGMLRGRRVQVVQWVSALQPREPVIPE